MKKIAVYLALLAAVVIAPIALRVPGKAPASAGADRLIIVTPHNEAIRHELGRAFRRHYQEETGRAVVIDWRTPGGTSEIARYINSQFVASFRSHWEQSGKTFDRAIERAFDNTKVKLDDTSSDDTAEEAARRTFLNSQVGCGIDLFFGGGSFDFSLQAAAGRLVDSGVIKRQGDLFGPQGIPQNLAGEPFWDKEGRWVGTCLSAFGICYNQDSLRRLGLATPPVQWPDLADPRYRDEIALANPTQSGSVNKAFEMLIQQQIHEAKRSAPSDPKALEAGWDAAMRLILKIGANARYFTDSALKISLDVAAGEAAAGMTIDFYGRFESEAVRGPGGESRLGYADARSGASFGADPIGLFRGAPNPDLARRFIDWSLSAEAQKLWNWKVGTAGGPERYALRRLPILPSLYAQEFSADRSDPDVNPYAAAADFQYDGAATGPLFRVIGFIVRVMCIDPHDELSAAWADLGAAGFPDAVMDDFLNVSAVSYAEAKGPIREALTTKAGEVRMARELGNRFRAQYLRAREQARTERGR